MSIIKPTRPEIIISCVLAICFAVEANYVTDTTFEFSIVFILQLLTFAVLFCTVFTVGRLLLAKLQTKTSPRNNNCPGYLEKIQSLSSLRLTAIATAIILAFWLPYLIALYPGNMSNDTVGQLCSFFSFVDNDGLRTINNHHPIMDTLVFGAIIYPFYALGHFRIGLFLCLVLQMLATALSFSAIFVVAIRQWRAPLNLAGHCSSY